MSHLRSPTAKYGTFGKKSYLEYLCRLYLKLVSNRKLCWKFLEWHLIIMGNPSKRAQGHNKCGLPSPAVWESGGLQSFPDFILRVSTKGKTPLNFALLFWAVRCEVWLVKLCHMLPLQHGEPRSPTNHDNKAFVPADKGTWHHWEATYFWWPSKGLDHVGIYAPW